MTRTRVVWLVAIGLAVVAVAFMATGHWARAALALVLTSVPFIATVPWRKKVVFACATVLLSAAATLAFGLGVDLYLHHRFAGTGGYNIWGYRGDTVGRKRPGQTRVLFLGGSVAFGYGVSTNETIPWHLQQDLGAEMPGVQVINAGWNSEGAYSMRYTLQDYEYLQADAAILYSGYNDLLEPNQVVFRHRSAIFRLTGYLPILPIIPLRDWLRVNNLSDTASGKVVFKPGLADRSATEAADTALRISRALERQLGKLASPDQALAAPQPAPQMRGWQHYTAAVRSAIETALGQHLRVFVVTEPSISDRHIEQQAALAHIVDAAYRNDARVIYVNAGRAVDLHDRALCYDGMHLTGEGNRRVAAFLKPFISDGLRGSQAGASGAGAKGDRRTSR